MASRLLSLQKGMTDSWQGSDSGLGDMTKEAFQSMMAVDDGHVVDVLLTTTAAEAAACHPWFERQHEGNPDVSIPRLGHPRRCDLDRRITEIFSPRASPCGSGSVPFHRKRRVSLPNILQPGLGLEGAGFRPNQGGQPDAFQSVDTAPAWASLEDLKCPTARANRRGKEVHGVDAHAAPFDDESESTLRDSALGDDCVPDTHALPERSTFLDFGPAVQLVPQSEASEEAEYVIESQLGEGAFSTVWKATHGDQEVVIKSIEVLPRYHNEVGQRHLTEAELTGRLQHPHVIELLDSWICGGTATLVLEYLPQGDMFNALDRSEITTEQSMICLIQVAEALQYIHREGVVHNDLKLENILLGESGIKLCDFGLAGLVGETRRGIVQGTAAYMAPELLAVKENECYALTPALDVWAFGIVTYAVVFAVLPWESAEESDDMYHQFVTNNYVHTSEMWALLSESLQESILGMLAESVEHRSSMAEVAAAIERPWLKEEHSEPTWSSSA
eukprot:m.157312 g.157312  ORF g.157312 m.157312 type:complete len:503 (+) comp23659_c0_seq1:279-1787(+)